MRGDVSERVFKCFRLHGHNEDHEPMHYDAIEKKMLDDVKWSWRIAGATWHKVTKVFTVKRSG